MKNWRQLSLSLKTKMDWKCIIQEGQLVSCGFLKMPCLPCLTPNHRAIAKSNGIIYKLPKVCLSKEHGQRRKWISSPKSVSLKEMSMDRHLVQQSKCCVRWLHPVTDCQLCSWFQLLVNSHPGRQEVMTKVSGYLSSTWETRIVFLGSWLWLSPSCCRYLGCDPVDGRSRPLSFY